jgi:hypothetical protein
MGYLIVIHFIHEDIGVPAKQTEELQNKAMQTVGDNLETMVTVPKQNTVSAVKATLNNTSKI